jgi:hypothetical protein
MEVAGLHEQSEPYRQARVQKNVRDMAAFGTTDSATDDEAKA